MGDHYTCEYGQVLNIFGAGIPNEYKATLRRNGKVIATRTFWWRRRAENQCLRWKQLYDAVMVACA